MSHDGASEELPTLSPDIYESYLKNDTILQIADALTISQSRERQISTLSQQSEPASTRTVTEIDDDEEEPHRLNKKLRTVKYTVKDSAQKLAFMLILDPEPIELHIGAKIKLVSGTKIWRSVLIPQNHQIRQLSKGVDLQISEQLERLKHV